MHRTREILRQKWLVGRSHREVAASVGVSVGVVCKTVSRAQAAGLNAYAIEQLDDKQLDVRLYGERNLSDPTRPEPDCAWLHHERQKRGVTLELLHLEYLQVYPNGYKYTQFCQRYRRWLKKRRLSMRQVYRAGEKLFVDFAGTRPAYQDPRTGERVEVELFVAVLGASSYTFAKAVWSQRSEDFLQAHVDALEYFGGVPQVLVPDQLRSAVKTPCRYEPEGQREYEDLARHYGAVVIPARPAKPKDKAKVEAGVLVATRWILARLRNETFFSLESLNERIAELLEDLNRRKMKQYGQSRRDRFEVLDADALQSLPERRFEYGRRKTCRVNIDYHVELEGHLYSVPHQLVHEKVETRSTATMVEIFHHGERAASHARGRVRGGHTTDKQHMPKSHRAHAEWSPSRILNWASTVGPRTEELAQTILRSRPHPEMGYRSCLGIIRLERKYGRERLEAACARALALKATSYRHVATTLKNGMETSALPSSDEVPSELRSHENLRGSGYYS